ncbi:AAA family ATPase [Actinomadura sp. B10D3]|uniref:helix-turn-helix transcriptional regulator n=1 Tax=Actinomadura sp. B10D3 TaxID=3153557 RepID=UPI00325D68D3
MTGRPVGRAGALDELISAVGAAMRGGGAVVVRGEAGIGKSVLLESAAVACADPGWHVLRLRPDELDRAIPYGALGHALREAGDEQQVRAAVRRRLDMVRETAPALIVVDDLRLLDDATIILLADALRRPAPHPMVLAGALRAQEAEAPGPLGAFMNRVTEDRHSRIIDLDPLGDAEIDALVAALAGTTPDGTLAALVRESSGGNPFVATQAFLHLAPGDPGAGLPADRRDAVLHRMVGSDPVVRRVARAAALLGVLTADRFPLLAELAAVPAADADMVFDGLVARGLVVETPEPGRFRFRHRLVRDALEQEIGPAQRRRWHETAARVLGEFPRTPELDLEIAGHVRASMRFGDRRAIEILAAAAERALASSPRSAIPWYQDALAITPPGGERHAELSARLARALFLAGRPREAAEAGAAALRGLPPGERRANLASLVVGALTEISAIAEAADLIDAERTTGRAGIRLGAQAAYVLSAAGRSGEADAEARRVLAGLGRGSPVERINALVNLAHMRCISAGFSELPALWDELLRAAAEAPPAARLNAFAAMSHVLAIQGRSRDCAESISRAEELLSRSPWGLYRAEVSVAHVRNAANLGDWDNALTLAEDTVRELEDAGSLGFLAALRQIQCELLANRGEWAAARQTAGLEWSSHPAFGAFGALALAEIDWLTGDAGAAVRRLEDRLAGPGVPDGLRVAMLSRLAEIAAGTGDVAAVRRLTGQVTSRWAADQLDLVTVIGCRLALGRVTRDAGLLAEAAALADEHGLALLRGKARLYLGALDAAPERNLHRAIRIFGALGAVPWRRQAAAELRRRGLKVPRRRRRAPGLLTETEAQIARLVQLGRPNREIAGSVSLSVKTVEAYLSRIYAKTGCSGRLELARALDRGDLPVAEGDGAGDTAAARYL